MVHNTGDPAPAHTLGLVPEGTETTSSDEFHPEVLPEGKNQKSCSPRREKLRKKRELQLKEFLDLHGFHDPCEPQPTARPTCFSFSWRQEEVLYPIHVAATHGEGKILRLLIDAGADHTQRTSKGRTALEFAQLNGWTEAAAILENPVKPVKVREMLKTMQAASGHTELYL
eukprot:symbB.v1.2.018242.t1/scaffold1447.1/size118252/2